MNRLPFDFAVWKQVIKSQATLFFILIFMSLLFLAFGFGIWFGINDGLARAIGMIFIFVGAGICVLALISTYNSCQYAYGQALLKRYGKELNATLIEKEDITYYAQLASPDDYPEGKTWDNQIPPKISELPDDAKMPSEPEFRLAYRYRWDGKDYASEAIIDDSQVFAKAKIGDTVPIILLPQSPIVTQIRLNTFKRYYLSA